MLNQSQEMMLLETPTVNLEVRARSGSLVSLLPAVMVVMENLLITKNVSSANN